MRHGEVWHGRHGMVVRGEASLGELGYGMVRQARRVPAFPGELGQCESSRGTAGMDA